MTNEDLDRAMSGRHVSTTHFQQMFVHSHLPPDLAKISSLFGELVIKLLASLGDGPEFTVGLRKLLEAKDAFVRQAVIELYAKPRE